MKILSPNDSSHTITVYSRDHSGASGYTIRVRNEDTKATQDVAATAYDYDSDTGLLELTFPLTVKEGQYYSFKVYTSGGALTVDSTLYTVDTTLLTCDMTVYGLGSQLHRGMIFCTTQTNLPKYRLMTGEVVQPTHTQYEFITPD